MFINDNGKGFLRVYGNENDKDKFLLYLGKDPDFEKFALKEFAKGNYEIANFLIVENKKRNNMEIKPTPENLELLEGDMEDILSFRLGKADVIITDPPYGRQYLPLYELLGRKSVEFVKDGGSILVMTGQSYLPDVLNMLSKYLKYHWSVAYETPGGQSAQLWARKVNTFWKPVLWFTNGEYNGHWVGDVAKSAVNDNDKRFHHWGQSESGMADLVRRFSKEGDIVLDPFMGGGTTGLVALKLGRKFIGIERDKGAFQVANDRIRIIDAEPIIV